MTISAAAATGFAAFLAGSLLGPSVVRLAGIHLQRARPFGFRAAATAACVPGLIAAAALNHGGTDGIILIPLTLLGGAAALVDVHERRLPDALTGALIVLTAALVAAVGIAEQAGANVLRSILTAGALTAGAMVLKVVRTDAIGWGDVKLMPTLGAVLGWWDSVVLGVFLWAMFIAATALCSARQPSAGPVIPYGPALLAGTLGAVVLAG